MNPTSFVFVEYHKHGLEDKVSFSHDECIIQDGREKFFAKGNSNPVTFNSQIIGKPETRKLIKP